MSKIMKVYDPERMTWYVGRVIVVDGKVYIERGVE